MCKGQKQLSCNLFSVAITLYHFLHIFTLILATSTFLSAGRKSSQITALYSSVCEYYVQIASPRVCVEFAAFQCCLASRLAPKWEQPYITHERLPWVRFKSLLTFVIIHAADLRLRRGGRHHHPVFGFSAASNRLFFL